MLCVDCAVLFIAHCVLVGLCCLLLCVACCVVRCLQPSVCGMLFVVDLSLFVDICYLLMCVGWRVSCFLFVV